MKHIKLVVLTRTVCSLAMLILLANVVLFTSRAHAAPTPTPAPVYTCEKKDFFGLVPWYGYFNKNDFTPTADGRCDLNLGLVNADGTANVSNIKRIWLIALAIFEDLLRITGVLAAVFVIYGGIRYTTSQGEPENTSAARTTIINALIGAGIVMIAAVAVSFIGNALGAA